MTKQLPDEIFRALFDAAPDGIVVVDASGTIVLANPSAEQLFGYSTDELIGCPVDRLVPEAARDAHAGHRVGFHQTPRTRAMGRATDLHARRKDGSTVPVDILLSPFQSEDARLVIAVVRDMTEQRAAREKLEHLAAHDELTGLFNRRRFEREIDVHVAQGARYGGGALLMLDIDNFKFFNDVYGHAAGDEVLRHVADILRSRLRATDTVARFGGDEFALLLPHASADDAALVAEEILQTFRSKPAEIQGGPVPVTVSIGVASVPTSSTAHEVLVAADNALYAAKRAGRDRYVVACGDSTVGSLLVPDGTCPDPA